METIGGDLERIGAIVDEKYEILRHIGSGSFGILYEGQNLLNGKKVAIKAINNKKNDSSAINREIRIYRKYLRPDDNESFEGIPLLYWFGSDPRFGDIMVMDLLGPDLEKMFRLCNKRFSLKTVILLAIQMLDRLQTLHRLEIIHRDLKPENFLLGVDSDSHTIYIIDFGLSKSYIDRHSWGHIPFSENTGMTGTARYCSIGAQSGHEQSRRDDLESVAYILSYFYLGSLPWQGIKVRQYQKNKAILEVKLETPEEKLFRGMPPVFKEFLIYCKRLAFEAEPDYELWIDSFQAVFDRKGFVDQRYDWELFHNNLNLK